MAIKSIKSIVTTPSKQVNNQTTESVTVAVQEEQDVKPQSRQVLDIINQSIESYKDMETVILLHVIVRGAIATEYQLDVSQFTLLQLVEYLVTGLEQKGKIRLATILFPLTTEYTLATIGAKTWDYKEATMKIVNILLKEFN